MVRSCQLITTSISAEQASSGFFHTEDSDASFPERRNYLDGDALGLKRNRMLSSR